MRCHWGIWCVAAGKRVMTRLTLIILVSLSLLFILMIGMVQLFPAPDSPIDRLPSAFESTCASTCFMGIQPGITHPDEARALLATHDWVGNVSEETLHLPSYREIRWTWSGTQPAWIDATQPGSLFVQEWQQLNDLLALRVRATLTLGDLWFAYGQPDSARGDVLYALDLPPRVDLWVLYPQQNLLANLQLDCPITPSQYWQQPVTLHFGRVLGPPEYVPSFRALRQKCQ